MATRVPSKYWILPAAWMMIGVGGNALILRPQFRELERDLKSELNTDLDELSTDLKELVEGDGTDIRTLCDSTLTDADLKDANGLESRREGS